MNTLLVTAYTPGYRDLYERLDASARAVGARLFAITYDSTGDWVRNGHVKPDALLAVMEDRGADAVCWVDADAVLRSRPTLLDDLPAGADVAFHTVPKTREALSGTVWTRSRAFLEAWAELLWKSPAQWDQRVLVDAVERSGAAYHNLPAEYCWIDYFAEPRWGGPRVPVIEHTQASREVRAGTRKM